MKIKKSFTLAEALLAAFILVIIGAVVVSMVANSSLALERTRNYFSLSSHASTIFEHIRGLNRTQLQAQMDNAQYWNDLIDNKISNESVSLSNINPADTAWTDDPLGLKIELTWDMRTHKQNETYLTYFTFYE